MKKLKKLYIPPVIVQVELDTKISLQLASAEEYNPDNDPLFLKAPEYFIKDPYKTNQT